MDLAWALSQQYELAGIVWYRPLSPKGALITRLRPYANPRHFWEYALARLSNARTAVKAQPFVNAMFPTDSARDSTTRLIPSVAVDNVNVAEAIEFVKRMQPEVVCVNGTNLLRAPMLALASSIRHGFINLHTGLSPYSRGGNCDLFMLLEGHPEFVGITIHHIDEGIDSGDIIITARPKLAVEDSYEVIEAKSFRLGNDMMVVALRQLLEGRAQRVPQWERGKLFLRRTGYVYRPYYRFLVNRALRNGLVAEYLECADTRDASIRLIGSPS